MSGDAEPVQFEQLRDAGRHAAHTVIAEQAPKEPLARVAWMMGYGEVDEALSAVTAARQLGHTWQQIADATGLPLRTAISRFERARKRAEG